ncbi:MAG TPA: GNAT family N-acetyltransferase [Geminicoccus sp.]|uniref:GNAT family N-acetyltransferase n=1 Tax=Geminicoccus sp. TaxID=2024832 RepID=UPI002CD6C9EA|nr:GNAT family N-acetyltransferase [Geminicoccus sp.]HWL70795.1 GNAT family N-acetyltransferase [Geminicoccus sp.]
MSQGGIRLETARLVLRPPDLADVPEMFAAITPELTRYLSFDPPASVEVLADIVASWRTGRMAGDDLHFALRSRDDGIFVGMAGLHALRTSEPEIGIWIREALHGRGLGREAIAGLAGFAFRDLGVASLLYPVAVANLPSRRLVEGLGGVPCGSRSHRKYEAVVYRLTREKLPG